MGRRKECRYGTHYLTHRGDLEIQRSSARSNLSRHHYAWHRHWRIPRNGDSLRRLGPPPPRWLGYNVGGPHRRHRNSSCIVRSPPTGRGLLVQGRFDRIRPRLGVVVDQRQAGRFRGPRCWSCGAGSDGVVLGGDRRYRSVEDNGQSRRHQARDVRRPVVVRAPVVWR